MSISQISGSADWYSQSVEPTRRQKPDPALTDTASLLGISTSQLSSDLRSGRALSSLAAADGVSSSDLLSSVESDLSANAPQGANSLKSDPLTQLATGLINGTPLPDGPGGAGGVGPNGSAPGLTNTASLLGTNSSQLSSDLPSGQTLSTLAAADGVSSSDLLSSVESDLSANAPQGASVSSDQLKEFASSLIDGNILNAGQPSIPGDVYGLAGSTRSDGSGTLYDQYA